MNDGTPRQEESVSEVRGKAPYHDVRDEVWDLSERGEISGSDLAADKELRRVYRELAKSSLYFFVKGVLGYPDLVPSFHKPYCDFLQDLSKKRTMDLMPRSTFKTSVGTIGFGSWYAVNHPDHFVLIANQTATNAQRMLSEIAQHFEGGNQMINWLFPECVRPGDSWKPWNSEQITFPSRTVLRGTPTFTAFGVGAKAESNHFHVIINDDLIGKAAMESDLVMESTIQWHGYSVSLFVRPDDGIERIHGTRWGLADLYSYLMERSKHDLFYRKAMLDDGTSAIPELISTEFLRDLREHDFSKFMSQYQNDPVAEESLDFRREWLNYYSLVKTDDGPACEYQGERYFVKDMDVQMFVDPAGSGDVAGKVTTMKARANNAVMVWGLHGTGKYFLLDSWEGRGRGENPERQIALEMLKMYVRWKGYVRKGHVEAYGAQRALITVFNMVAHEEGEAFRIEEIGRGNVKAKHVRIRSYIGPAAQNGQIYVRRAHDQFVMEFSLFPQGTSYDTLDASAWAFATLKRPATSVERKVTHERHERKTRMRLKTRSKTGY